MGMEAAGNGLKTRLETIPGLRVYAPNELPKKINEVPAAIILPGATEYDQTFGNATQTVIFRVLIILTNQDQPEALAKIYDYADSTGNSSVYAAVDGDTTLDGNADDSRVTDNSGAGAITWGGHEYLGTEFTVEVYI